MLCKHYQNNIDEYLDHELDAEKMTAFQQHIDGCVQCQSECQQTELLRNLLATMPYKTARQGFYQATFERIRWQYPDYGQAQLKNPKFKKWIQMSFAGTLAAGFVLWAVLAIFISAQHNNIPIVDLTLNQTLTVPIAFNAPDDFDKVTVSMQIPAQVELVGHKGEHTLSWETYLAKGNNLLKLPLTAIAQGDGLFMARLKHGNKVKTFTFHLRITQDDLSMKQAHFELFRT